MNPSDTLTEQQKWILAITPRIAACISVVCITYMSYCIISQKWARQRIYHRLMLGCTIPILILNTAQLWGPSAAPTETTDWVIGATGNYTTCSIQGFMYQFRLVVPSYYLILSLLARRLVITTTSTNNNKKQKQQRSRSRSNSNSNSNNNNNNNGDNSNNNNNNNNNNTNRRNNIHHHQHKQALYMKRLTKLEPFLHVGVYIFPIISGLFLLSIDGFNMILLGCGVSSEPLGCGDDSGIECTRGPQNPGFYQWLFAGLPSIILLGSSTIIMIVTLLQLCFATKSSMHVAISMAKQSSLYLLALYWTYIFRWIDASLILNHNMYVFGVNLLAEIIDPLQGLWTLLVYWYFKSDKPKTSQSNDDNINDNSTTASKTIKNQKVRRKSSSSNQNNDDSPDSSISFRPEFSIFDGTRISTDSPWAAYLSDDYGEDDSYIEFCGEYTDKDFRTNSSSSAGTSEQEEEKEEIQSRDSQSSSSSSSSQNYSLPDLSSTTMSPPSRMSSPSSSSSTTTDDNKERSSKESISISKSTTASSRPQSSTSSTRTSCTARLSCETTPVEITDHHQVMPGQLMLTMNEV